MARVKRVILFGGSVLLARAADMLSEAGLEVLIYTSPRHAAEPIKPNGKSLAQVLSERRQNFTVCEDINSERVLPKLVTKNTLGIGMGQAWQFKMKLIELFGGRLLDFMGIPHPRYRGGAHYTWMIMRNDRRMGCHLQVINENTVQGEHDSGGLVFSHCYSLKPDTKTPDQYFEQASERECKFLMRFITLINNGNLFNIKTIDEDRSLYLPRLSTIENGWIDWRWSGVDIERFICAFDFPYVGASTMLGKRRIHLHECKLLNDEAPFHPYQAGLITRIEHGGAVVVATTSGHLRIKRITCASARAPDVRIGSRFITPESQLRRALDFRPLYTASRIKKQRRSL
jgi:methionyl-tRNA formyltransferase